ncbi:hypothetical protein [Maribacter ulvicola]|uniref:Uncharacterized protein n=1 Tax=Maribacter ulvicola TaxID=228959 RepID=A0A1N6QWN5_9FLAO|nr:hypothetical protein [Maribacter ulvicola]SIQ21031.1 hypothetical protein SAMN05421797_1011052 [Maribacter ulvicola]
MNTFKKAILALTLTVSAISMTNAQSGNDYNQLISYGLKGGVSLSNLRGDVPGIESKNKKSISIGFFAE